MASRDLEILKKSVRTISDSLDTINSEYKLVYNSLSKLNKNGVPEIYKFDSDVGNACIEYLKGINTIQSVEMIDSDRRIELKHHKELYVKLSNSMKTIMNHYNDLLNTVKEDKNNIKLLPKFIYNDGYKSDLLNYELVNQYPGSYYYKKLYNNEKTMDNGNVYIDYDSKNEDLLIKYMKEDNTLINDIKNMKSSEKTKLLNDLDFFNLPLKIRFVSLLGSNEDTEIIDRWKNKRMVTVNGKIMDNISEELRNNGKIKEIYNEQVFKDIHYDIEKNLFSINIDINYSEIIEDFLKNGRKWNNRLLLVKQLTCDSIVNEMTKYGLNLNDNEKNELEQAWMSVRFVFVNSIYNKSIDDCLKNENQFKSMYLKHINNEQLYEQGYLFISIQMKCPDTIEFYLNNHREWDTSFLSIEKLKYSDIINDLCTIGIHIDETEMNALKNKWMSTRQIYINNNYAQSMDHYLKQSSQFISIYEKNMNTEHRNESNGYLYVNVNLKYDNVLLDYATHENVVNYSQLEKVKDYKYNDVLNEFNIMGISLNKENMTKLKSFEGFSFLKISQILDNYDYNVCLNAWLGNEYEWKCIYRASEHGYTGISFHDYCDDMGPTLILIKSQNGYIFGGYTTQSWHGWTGKTDNNAFLFTLYNPHGVPPTCYNSIKKIGGIYCDPGWGPTFDGRNGYDLCINCRGKNCNEENSCCIWNDGTRGYECDPKYKRSLFTNTADSNSINYFSVADYEVFAHK